MIDYLIKTPDDVLQVIEQFEKQEFTKPIGKDLLTMLEVAVKDVQRKTLVTRETIDWKSWFLRTGFIVYSILIDYKFDKLHFAKFLLGKHKKYGLKPLLMWEELGIAIRLSSKIARLVNITNNLQGVDLGDETVEDTLKDVLGYCILGHLLTCRIHQKEEG